MRRSAIFRGKVMHSRRSPVEHTFEYPVYSYRLDLDELSGPERSFFGGLFGVNTLRPVSIWDKDYLFERRGSIKARLWELLHAHHIDTAKISAVDIVTGARFFNYVFNPVNFYFCYDAVGEVLGHVVEINNTYHQRHPYVLFNGERSFGKVTYRADKAFFVSPFNRIEGRYQFVFALDRETLDVRIDLHNEGSKPLATRVWGAYCPLTTANLLATLVAFPLAAVLTMPRILWQAQLLRFKKKLPMLDPPVPPSADTIDTG